MCRYIDNRFVGCEKRRTRGQTVTDTPETLLTQQEQYGQSKESGPLVTFKFYTAAQAYSVVFLLAVVVHQAALLRFYAIASPRGHWKIKAQRFFIEREDPRGNELPIRQGPRESLESCGKIGCRTVEERIERKRKKVKSTERTLPSSGKLCEALALSDGGQGIKTVPRFILLFAFSPFSPRETTLESPLFMVRLKQNWKGAWYLPIDFIQTANISQGGEQISEKWVLIICKDISGIQF